MASGQFEMRCIWYPAIACTRRASQGNRRPSISISLLCALQLL
jgi:hypothetical protein